jgi:hypothetical protein
MTTSFCRPTVLTLFATTVLAGSQDGIEPRKNVSDYPAYAELQNAAIGAVLLSAEQVRANFVSDLNRGYLVVEVAACPKNGSIELVRRHFVLKSASGTSFVRAADPKTVAAGLHRAAGSDRNVTLYPSAGIGYESGPRVYDPATGEQRGGGLITSTGVGVGMGPSQSGASEQDRRVMETELSEKGLPECQASKPVSGYLYFPLSGKKKGAFVLECDLGAEKPLVLKLVP